MQVLAGVAIVATLLFATACSSSEEEDVKQPEQEQPETEPTDPMEKRIKELTTPGTDERPSWTMNYDLYEQKDQTMSIQVVPQKFLTEYISDDDLMCAMIGGEVRALTGTEQTNGQYYFPLVIAGNGNEGMVSISYYCSSLKRIYTLANWELFDADIIPTYLGRPQEIIFDQEVYDWWMDKYEW